MGIKREQSSLGDQQIRQAKQREELCRILRQSTITRLPQRKYVLDEVEGMLNLGPDAGLDLLSSFTQSPALVVQQRTALARPQGNVPAHLAVAVLFPLLDTLVTGVAESSRLFAVQQGVGLGNVADIGRSGDNRVGQPRFGVNPDAPARGTPDS